MADKSINNNTPKIIGAVVISGIIAIALITFVLNPGQESSESQAPVSTLVDDEPVSLLDAATQTPTSTSANGDTGQPTDSAEASTETLSANTTYSVPKGHNNGLKISLTINDGKITDVSTQHQSTSEESAEYAERFDNGVRAAVIGKALTDIKESRINGASLTSEAFYQAISNL